MEGWWAATVPALYPSCEAYLTSLSDLCYSSCGPMILLLPCDLEPTSATKAERCQGRHPGVLGVRVVVIGDSGLIGEPVYGSVLSEI